jgi:hypothetical protein
MPELTEKEEAAIQQMSNLVVQMVTMAGTRAQDFLTITNGGAAIACLAMIGSSSPYANDAPVKIFLAMFVLGLVLAGVTMVRGFRYTTKLAWAFGDTVPRLRRGEAQWDDLMAVFDPKVGKALFRWNVRIGAASLTLFGVGAVCACTWLIGVSWC